MLRAASSLRTLTVNPLARVPKTSLGRAFLSVDRNETRRKAREITRQQRKTTAVSSTVVRVAKAGRDWTVVAGGAALVSVIFYTLFKVLFSQDSPLKVYEKSLREVKLNSDVVMLIGEPVKGFDERKGRGRQVDSEEFQHLGNKHVRVAYGIQGSHGRGQVIAEMAESNSIAGGMEFVFVAVQVPRHRPIFVIDNRSEFQEEVLEYPLD